MKFVLYTHGGSKNHGCEAIVRSTIKILQQKECVLLSYNEKEDIAYGLDKIIEVRSELNKPSRKSLDFIYAYFMQKVLKKYEYINALYHKQALTNMNCDDIAFFIGGDNYCYSNVKDYLLINKMLRKKVKRTVLWGTSIEPEILNDKSVWDDINNYNLITVRESLSYEGLKKAGIKTKIVLLPDPAFQLDRIELPLPDNFLEGKTVGINVSPLIMGCETKEGITKSNYIDLIEYILEKTDMNIALIPHVVWKNNDDRKPLLELFELFKDSNRICIIDDNDCMKLKGYISRCRFFVGARTHATIAAYSSMVPTLVVGYSIKAKGIAKDLFGTYENYVLPVQSLENPDDLTNSFKWLQINEKKIRERLQNVIPSYVTEAMKAKNEIDQLL